MFGLVLGLVASADLRAERVAACTQAVALPITVEQLSSDPKSFRGRCVTVSGPSYNQSMFSGVEGIYLSTKPDDSGNLATDSYRHRIGLYFSEKQYRNEGVLTLRLRRQFTPLTITGIVDSCGAMADRLPPSGMVKGSSEGLFTVHTLGGYCHYWGGAVVWANQRSASRGGIERLRGEAARQRYGDLARLSPGWRHYAWFQQFAGRVRIAILKQDRETLRQLFGATGEGRANVDFLLSEPLSPFRELRRGEFEPEFVILGSADIYKGLLPEQRTGRDALVCFCRGPDCSETWPISRIDADPDPDHPYACVAVEQDDTGRFFASTLYSRGDRAPLLEPRTSWR